MGCEELTNGQQVILMKDEQESSMQEAIDILEKELQNL